MEKITNLPTYFSGFLPEGLDAAESLRFKLRLAAQMEEEGYPYSDNRTYQEFGYASRRVFLERLQEHAVWAFGDLVRRARLRKNEKFGMGLFSAHLHPASLIEHAIETLAPYTGLSLLSEEIYQRSGETRTSFIDLLHTARIDRILQSGRILSGLQTGIMSAEEARMVPEFIADIFDDLECLGVDPEKQSFENTEFSYYRDNTLLMLRSVLSEVIPILWEERAPSGDVEAHWQSMDRLGKAINCYTNLVGGEDLEKVLGFDEDDWDAMKLVAFIEYMNTYWSAEQAELLNSYISENGWENDPAITIAFKQLGYQSAGDYTKRKTLDTVASHLTAAGAPDTTVFDTYNAYLSARDALKPLGADPEKDETYRYLNMTGREAFEQLLQPLAAKVEDAYFELLHDPSIDAQDEVRLILSLMQSSAFAGELSQQQVPQEALVEYKHAAIIRQAELPLLNFMAAYETPKAFEHFDAAMKILDDIPAHLLELDVYTGLGLSAQEAEALNYRAEYLTLQGNWIRATDKTVANINRYRDLTAFSDGVRYSTNKRQLTVDLSARFSFANWRDMCGEFSDIAQELCLPFYADFERACTTQNWNQARDLQQTLTRCMNYDQTWKQVDEITFRKKYGFSRSAYSNCCKRVKAEEKASSGATIKWLHR